ncbi:PREDICTED: olfactory receptor 10A7-like [Nanorana parkeri]|uniref:olfactory receptor 10A7-like n=1 Tax=Nanorana parkeri TaxID=125878 RepID=UPI0008542906|nr:PREDICTED: olfactory receptor 10A7-like [Nanorana parkeri]
MALLELCSFCVPLLCLSPAQNTLELQRLTFPTSLISTDSCHSVSPLRVSETGAAREATIMNLDSTKATYKNNVTTIFFVGFQNHQILNLFLFPFFLIIYIVTICGNLLIIMLVSYSKGLHSPMYFFLTQLSVSDIMLSTDITPNMLNIVLHGQTSISLVSCLTQYYFFGLLEAVECFLLTVMSYDRYLAICSPLHYASIMNHMFCIKLVVISWLFSCSVALILTLSMCQLQFCGPNTIDHFLCDFYPLVQLSCSDVSIIQMQTTLLSIPVLVVPFLVIVVSYTCIVSTILKISSNSGRVKTFSTCSSHLTVVFIFYGTLIATYMIPNGGQSHIISKTLALLYTVFTPFLNPFIYSLRNNDIKEAIRNVLNNKMV